ncbi:MAG TPA: hypothetical protein VLS45_00650 [Methylomicrobium sp.]|nr:hypothetical protein [Methylomicrobium sp.]
MVYWNEKLWEWVNDDGTYPVNPQYDKHRNREGGWRPTEKPEKPVFDNDAAKWPRNPTPNSNDTSIIDSAPPCGNCAHFYQRLETCGGFTAKMYRERYCRGQHFWSASK